MCLKLAALVLAALCCAFGARAEERLAPAASPPGNTPAQPSAACAGTKPEPIKDADGHRIAGHVAVRFDINKDGMVSGIKELSSKRAQPQLLGEVERWLRGCLFDPARKDGAAIATFSSHAFWFPGEGDGQEGVSVFPLGDRRSEGAAKLFGSGMSPPVPACGTHPAVPEEARREGITGLVLASFVVHSDGTVGEFEYKNPSAPPILVEAVRAWLTGCAYAPGRLPDGKAIPVKIIQPFTFKAAVAQE
jgi:outer membrane biosynthesis protein TonB